MTHRSSNGLAGGSGASAAVPVPAGAVAGDIAVVGVYKENTAAVTPPAGFTQKAALTTSGTSRGTLYVFWKRLTAGDSGTYSFTWSGSTFRAGVSGLWSGRVASGDPFDGTVGTAESTTSVTSLNVSTSPAAASGDAVGMWTDFTGGNAWTQPTNYTERQDRDVITLDTRDSVVSGSTGSVSATANVSGFMKAFLGVLAAAGGTTHTDSAGLTDTTALARTSVLTDSTGLTDTSAVEPTKLVAQTDSAGLTDSAVLSQTKGLTDSAGLTDAAAFTQSDVLTDTAGLTDTAVVESGRAVAQTDSAGLTDSQAVSRTTVLTDLAGLTDTTALTTSKVTTDSAGLTDAAAAGILRDVAATDSAGLTDATILSRTAVLTDLVGLADTAALSQLRVLTDSAGLSDATEVGAGLPVFVPRPGDGTTPRPGLATTSRPPGGMTTRPPSAMTGRPPSTNTPRP